MNEISLENEIIILSTETVIKLFNYDNGADLAALYLFYHKQCKFQKTNQTWSEGDFVMRGLHWGEDRFKKAKKILMELNLIENIRGRSDDGTFGKWYIRLNYIKSPTTLETNRLVEPTVGSQRTNALSSNNINALSSEKENIIPTETNNNPLVDIKKENKNKEIAELAEKIFIFWNSQKWSLENQSGDKFWKGLRKMNDTTKKILIKILNEYSKEEIQLGVDNYKKEIKDRKNDGKGYFEHRFTIDDFFTRKGGFKKFVNII